MRADLLPVTSAAQSAARDAAAIAAGTNSFVLMLRAGTVIAEAVLRTATGHLSRGVLVCAGSGNNGGDGYVAAVQLHRAGVRVSLWAAAAPGTADAQRAARLARAELPARAFVEAPVGLAALAEPPGSPVALTHSQHGPSPSAHPSSGRDQGPGVVVDALLGTGARGALREPVDHAARWIAAARQRGAFVVAADVPSGLDATSGQLAAGTVRADVTVALGTCKAGLLAARGHVGDLVVADIGLGESAHLPDQAPALADPSVLREQLPPIAWDAHKGTRGRVLLVGGQRGMAGAAQFAARGALLSGAGLVQASVAWEAQAALQASVPETMCLLTDREEAARDWAHAIIIGPGLGRGERAAARMDDTVRGAAVGVAALVLDADALGLLAEAWPGRAGGEPQVERLPMSPESPTTSASLTWSETLVAAFRRCAESRPVVLTPHWGEFRTLAEAVGVPVPADGSHAEERLRAVREVAAAFGCTVVLKGTPTLCTEVSGATWTAARGAPTLASGGSGDLLSGIIGALLAGAQVHAGRTAPTTAPTTAQLCASAAWVHGVAGELAATRAGGVRGTRVSDVADALPAAWRAWQTPERLPPGVLAQLPRTEA